MRHTIQRTAYSTYSNYMYNFIDSDTYSNGTCVTATYYTGGISAGLISDILNARAFTSTASLYLSIPSVSLTICNLNVCS